MSANSKHIQFAKLMEIDEEDLYYTDKAIKQLEKKKREANPNETEKLDEQIQDKQYHTGILIKKIEDAWGSEAGMEFNNLTEDEQERIISIVRKSLKNSAKNVVRQMREERKTGGKSQRSRRSRKQRKTKRRARR